MVVLKPNVVRGGRAIGLGNNLYLMKGRTHSKGGIDIGKNPKTGLEVENNEVMQVSPQGVRVFSAQPILGGISPAQYILGGANPNQVFNAQEQWKKINRINDDGTKKAQLGKELYKKKHNVSLIDDIPEPEAPLNYDEIKRRQEFMESEFNSKAYNKNSGAKGRFQIRENALQDYIKAGGEEGDLFDSDYNEKVRDWIMEDLSKSSMVIAGNPTDSVKMAKQLAAYNWGRGNLSKFLQKQKAAGIDIYRDMSWIDSLPKETRDYVNFSLRNQDINDAKNNERYNSLIKRYGGRIITNNFISNFRKILPINLLKTIASTAHSSQRQDSFSLPSDNDPGNYFLLDYDRQEKELEKLGYKKIENEDYGLVKKAVTALEKDINKKIPIYKKGRDNASRDTLEVIYNGMSGDGKLPKEGELIHGGSYPYAIYKGKNSNKYYVKSWDLNDYGNHNNGNGTTYKGIRQKLANIYDKIGNPFVQTTGIKRIHKWDGLAIDENHLQYRYGGIHIKPSKRGTFTAAAKKHGMSVQGFASKVLANKGKYSSAMFKKARFAKNASKWKHKEFGGDMDFNYWITKDNIYKFGGRKKALIGDDILESSLIVANNGSNLDAARNKVLSSLPTTKSILTSFRDTLTPVEQKINKEEALRTIMSNQKDGLGTSGLSKGVVGQYLANGVQAGINIAGNIGSYLINRDAIRRMRGPAAPLPLRAESLPTRVSTAAQEAALRENIAKQENLLAGNLSSSRSRLNATNQIRNQGIGLYNQLQERKGEIERELITRDKLNRQGITNQNIAQVNQWRNATRDFENKRIDLNSENTIQHLVQGPADAIAGERGFFDNLASNDRYRMTAFLEAIKNPDALNAMNSDEIKQLARRFGVRTSWLRSIGINI